MGPQFESGAKPGPAASQDVAPTMLSVLGIDLGRFDGVDRSGQMAATPAAAH